MQRSRDDLLQLNGAKLRRVRADSLRDVSVELPTDLEEADERHPPDGIDSSRPPSSQAAWD